MQGIFMRDGQRPKSKKQIREAVAAGQDVYLEATSFFGNEYDGSVQKAPDGRYSFVGPDPHRKRNFYGTIVISGGVAKVS